MKNAPLENPFVPFKMRKVIVTIMTVRSIRTPVGGLIGPGGGNSESTDDPIENHPDEST
jgi:hypothetical protein